jgi:secondary thiamine-phosphate synthase enzyme
VIGRDAMQRELSVRSRRRTEVIDLTAEVAAVVINENDDPQLCDDLLDALDKLVPDGVWRHDRVDGNGAAHIKAAMLGPGETIPVRGGRLLLGTWQAIMLVDLDGPRQRRVVVTVR